jgi:hypothetical protein
MADDDDATAIAEAMAHEIRAKVEPMEIHFQPLSVFQVTGLLQLALRHPELTPELRETGVRFVAAVREYFADCPTVLDVVQKGDDPAFDVRRPGARR